MKLENMLSPSVLADLLGIEKRTLLEKIAPQPDFPPRISISREVFFWEKSDIEAWLESKKEKRAAL